MKPKLAVVSGGSEGIGLATVQALTALDYHVATCATAPSPALDQLVSHGKASFLRLDLTRPEAPELLLALAGEHVDALVNNVGLSIPRPDGFLSITDQDWRQTLDLNLMAAVRVLRAALPRMSAGGAIVNITSDNAKLPDPHLVDYGSAKCALASLTKSLSTELAPQRIRVNAVSPGPVDTRRWKSDRARRDAASRMPTGRLTTPDEVAHVIAFLLGEQPTNATGAAWNIDGGLIPVI